MKISDILKDFERAKDDGKDDQEPKGSGAPKKGGSEGSVGHGSRVRSIAVPALVFVVSKLMRPESWPVPVVSDPGRPLLALAFQVALYVLMLYLATTILEPRDT